jgi:hypothetical protein
LQFGCLVLLGSTTGAIDYKGHRSTIHLVPCSQHLRQLRLFGTPKG